jgi:hypothetical protein
MPLYETLKHQVIQLDRYGESGKVGEPKAPVENTFERYPSIRAYLRVGGGGLEA